MSSSTSTSEPAQAAPPTSPDLPRGRLYGLRAVGLALGVGLLVLVLLIVLPWLPVLGGVHYANPEPGARSMRYEPGEFVNSLSWDLREPVHGHINEQGFLSPFDFRTDQPAVAMFGDSFVEGLMVPYAKTISAQVQARLGSKPGTPALTAYNFGLSGASLPHYLGLAREVGATYDFKAAVIVITPGDYDEGFQALEGQYEWTADPAAGLIQGEAPRVRTGWKASLRKVALVRYLRQNLLVENLPLFRHPMAVDACAATGLTPTDLRRIDDYVADLPPALRLAPARIVLVFNHNPYSGVIYDPIDKPATAAAAKPCPSRDTLALERLAEAAAAAGIQIVDNTAMLRDEYRRERRLLDFTPVDRHWNPRAIELTAGAVASKLLAQ